MCVDTEIKELKDMIREMSDTNKQALINARESTAPSISAILLQIVSTMKKIEKDVETVQTDLEPIKKRFDNTNGFWKTILAIGKYAGVGAAIIYLYDMIADHIAHHLR